MRVLFALFICAVIGLMPAASARAQESFAPIVKKTAPAVVNIYAKVRVKQRVALAPMFGDPFFQQFFNQHGGIVQERLQNSLGSGVIVDPAGLIATNTHVVNNATEIIVVTTDGREFAAEKLLSDEKTDLAVLRIKPEGEQLPFLEFADTDSLEVGDQVLAIGNPFGVGQTVTRGIISGLARSVAGFGEYSSFIQTDAAINPGNSGGALVDMQGRLIGINTMIFSKTGGSIGLGFAIPANMVRAVTEVSKSGGKLVRPWTGLTGQAVSGDMVESLGLKRAQGALVNRVHPKGPAARAGLRAGDVILRMNGRDIKDPSEMKFRLGTMQPGGSAALDVWRGGKEIKIDLPIEAPPEDPKRDATVITGNNPLAGATVVNVSPAVAAEIEDIEIEKGVVIASAGEGIAARLGLRTGDVVGALNDKKVDSVKELLSMLSDRGVTRWKVTILRGKQQLNLIIGR